MTVLARSGVPGLMLWGLVRGGWFLMMFRAYRESGRDGYRDWQRVFLFVTAFSVAFLVDATFDVFLEGPMGGIWFWCLYGFGLGAVWQYRRAREVGR